MAIDRFVKGEILTADKLNALLDEIRKAGSVEDIENLKKEAEAIKQTLNAKQDTISDLSTIRSGAEKGATSLQNADKGKANGVASLDESGKVPSAQLPSYVDDVLEFVSKSTFPATGETGKIYVATNTNRSYRWTGSTYVLISNTLEIGETKGTAFDGERGVALEKTVEDNEKVSAAALNDLKNENAQLRKTIEDNEKVVASAFNDLLQRISSLETIVKENEKIIASAINDIR